MTKKKLLLLGTTIGVVIAALLAVGVWQGWFTNKEAEKRETARTQSSSAIRGVQETSVEGGDVSILLDKYGSQYDEVYGELSGSDPTKWTAADVDKAYFVIAFNEKTGGYRLISIFLSKLDEAKAAGVNIDSNSVGADDAYRQRLKDEAQKVTGGY